MATKLYPPNLEGTLPAFIGDKLIIPFSMNKTVPISSVTGINIKLKTVQNNIQLINTTTTTFSLSNSICSATLLLNKEQQKMLNIGQFYKIQIAYNSENGVGYYSSTGVIKYTAKPEVYIDGLEKGNVDNNHFYHYLGVYKQKDDTSEKIYSYIFNLYDENNNIIKTSGEQIHNTYNDIELYTSYDNFDILEELLSGKKYFLQYKVTTMNGLEAESPKYRIVQGIALDAGVQVEVEPFLDFENGYIKINLKGKVESTAEQVYTGTFQLVRASSEDGYQTWNEILKFALYNKKPSSWSWKDFTIKQGVTYKYGIQQYNEKLISKRIESKEIYADFEHAFLFDGTRQLKIKFNPKMTSFKDDVLEQKTDTIGGRYPYIFRNGNTKYKEFQISGLISIWSDEEQLFTSASQLLDTNLTGENIAVEREFKLEALSWLNNGLPKLFRSPTEGNYLVRLMNISLSPNDTLGRMLHTFTATAYEIADFSWSNLENYDFIQTSDPTAQQIRWETKQIADFSVNENMLDYEAVALKFEGMVPGDEIIIISKEGNVPEEIVIGITGCYEININTDTTITSVQLKSTNSQGQLTYAYYSNVLNNFSLIDNVKYYDVPARQFIGEHDILKEITNIKESILKVYQLHARRRDVANEVLYHFKGNFYLDRDFAKPFIIDSNFATEKIYRLYEVKSQKDETLDVLYYYDFLLDRYYSVKGAAPIFNEAAQSAYTASFVLNGSEIDLTDTADYAVEKIDNLTELKTSNGVIVELTYRYQELTYGVEEKLFPITKIPIDQTKDLLALIEVFIKRQNAYKNYYDRIKESLEKEGVKQGVAI